MSVKHILILFTNQPRWNTIAADDDWELSPMQYLERRNPSSRLRLLSQREVSSLFLFRNNNIACKRFPFTAPAGQKERNPLEGSVLSSSAPPALVQGDFL